MIARDLSGIELSRRFFREAVAPILSDRWPGLRYSAALIGHGSEVLGFDDAMSRDHHWGPRVQLFLDPKERRELEVPIREHLSLTLPRSFLGFPTNFSSPDPTDNGVQHLEACLDGPIRHRVDILDLESYLAGYLGIRKLDGIDSHDWLTFPEQKLRSLTAGSVFHDGLPAGSDIPAAFESPLEKPCAMPGDAADGNSASVRTGMLSVMRERLAWYPKEVWYYQMAAAWARIGQEEHLAGRAGLVGDEVGSAIICSRLVRDIMRLGFLIEGVYAPYPKWFGSAFKRLSCGPEIYPMLERVLGSATWKARDAALIPLYERIANMHNRLEITEPMPETAKPFFGRPFSVIAIHGFSQAILNRIAPDFLSAEMRESPIGGIDQVSDNTDLLEAPGFRSVLRRLYQSSRIPTPG
jgi:hypothetical protein